MKRLKEFLHNWQEPLLLLPLFAIGILFLFFLLPAIDPTSGIDGFADAFRIIISIGLCLLVFFLSWMVQKIYCRVVDKGEDDTLWRNLEVDTLRKTALLKILLDRGTFTCIVLLFYLGVWLFS